MYFAFFVVVGAAAYGLLATASAPQVSMSGDSYETGDPVTLSDRTYTVSVSSSGDTGSVSWVNESARLTESFDRGGEIPVYLVSWDDQRARHEATFEDGSTIQFNGSEYRVSVNGTAATLTLTDAGDANVSESFELEDDLEYLGNETTLISVTADAATVAWGGPYVVDINNESVANPTNATLVEARDYEALAAEDPALYNETLTQDGVLKVTYRANDTNVPVEEYFGAPERHLIAENGTLQYNGNETTVTEITNESVAVAWTGAQTNSIELAEGENFTAGGTQYFSHFPDNTSVQVFETGQRYDEYNSQREEISSYESRKLGLWGIAEISALAAIILLMAAYLPVRG